MKNAQAELNLVRDIFAELSRDLERMLERSLSFRDVSSAREVQRAVGHAEVHISFRFSLQTEAERKFGCLLLPLPDATVWASYLLALGEQATREARGIELPNRSMKESMLLLGHIISSSIDRAAKRSLRPDVQVATDGCQGVRADVRPAFDYVEGEPLILGRAAACTASFEPFRPILMLPLLA